jgi:hypothetical protein
MNKVTYRIVKHDGGWAYETAPRASENKAGQWYDDSG